MRTQVKWLEKTSVKTNSVVDFVIAVPKLTITLRTAFFNPGKGECFSPGESVAGVTFRLDGVQVTGKDIRTKGVTCTKGVVVTANPRAPELGPRGSREAGVATISLTGISDGTHTLEAVVPATALSTHPAGPSLVSTAERALRSVALTIELKDGRLKKAAISNPRDCHAYVTGFTDTELAIDLKPDWMRSPKFRSRGGQPIEYIVIHHTSGSIISGAINEALTKKGPHYEIDLDGHIVKYVSDADCSFHAGISRWKNINGVNERSIGIEIVNKDGPFSEAQYEALLRLIRDLSAAYRIAPYNILAHADVRTSDGDSTLLSDDRRDCPGLEFEWERLEREGFGWVLKEVELGDYCCGFYSQYPEACLHMGDSDTKMIFAGKPRDPPWEMTPIGELQADLAAIGYSLHASGDFDLHLHRAVDRFQRRYFTGSRRAQFDAHRFGQLDTRTAIMIKTVRGSLP